MNDPNFITDNFSTINTERGPECQKLQKKTSSKILIFNVSLSKIALNHFVKIKLIVISIVSSEIQLIFETSPDLSQPIVT